MTGKIQKSLDILDNINKENAALIHVFLSNTAHKIKNYLAGIKMASSLIEMSHQNPELMKLTQSIRRSVDGCSQEIDMELIKIHIITTAARDVTLETNNLSETIETALLEYATNKEEKLLIHYQKPNKPLFYTGNMYLTKHVIFNLIKNALLAIHIAQKGEIFIECYQQDTFTCLVFRDTALGIPRDNLPKIFEKVEIFEPNSPAKTRLGLAFCQLVMQSFSGKIECRSEPGEFTEFVLSFPIPFLS